jgi:hypothetical protein
MPNVANCYSAEAGRWLVVEVGGTPKSAAAYESGSKERDRKYWLQSEVRPWALVDLVSEVQKNIEKSKRFRDVGVRGKWLSTFLECR